MRWALYALDLFPAQAQGQQQTHGAGSFAPGSRWAWEEFVPAPGFVAALVVEGHGWHSIHRRFE
jgi:hypothetical protein